MIKRLLWLGGGAILGVWVVRKLSHKATQLTPAGLAGQVRAYAQDANATVRAFTAEVRAGMAAREAELRAGLGIHDGEIDQSDQGMRV